ncbi:MAG TPA: tRNA 2-thiouridine(34) synthase MnmA, partial [Polyangiaceae bacterium]|nr:tRNA 2-thiouridine(34) synthase MnmA [Polyangiaceae bacterium]
MSAPVSTASMAGAASTAGAVKERIVVAMSGGVDSSVAAARLVDAGYDVVGVTLHLWDYPDEGPGSHGRCCAPEDQYDARRVADAVGFPHYTFDRRELFARTVVAPFVDAYLQGDTPSPCTACNRSVKLAELFAIADRLGAARIATGHYARIARDDVGRPRLAMGADRAKDQSYFLYASPRAWLERLVFPLGDSTKPEVRGEAVARRLPGAQKGESQELCFTGAGSHAYADFVAARADGRVRAGPIVDEQGRTVGNHQGVHRFTIGQRRGLGVALGRPTFVTGIDADSGTVHLGGDEALQARAAELADVTLAEGVALPLRARVRVRYRHEGDAAVVVAAGGDAARSNASGAARVVFDAPVRAVTRGQIAVFYEGERVLGGGRIVGA